MSTNDRVDTTDVFDSSSDTVSPGFGVDASLIPNTGVNGAAIPYHNLVFPDDLGKEIRIVILSTPSQGVFTVGEDGAFTFSGAPAGTYAFTYQLYKDGVITGAVEKVILAVGNGGTKRGYIRYAMGLIS